MFSRRYLRIKVLQSLYAYYQSGSKDKESDVPKRKLLRSIDQVYESYILMLSLIDEVAQYAAIDADNRAHKYLPTTEDLSPNLSILNNRFIVMLHQDDAFLSARKKHSKATQFDQELIQCLFTTLQQSPEGSSYNRQSETSTQSEQALIQFIFDKVIMTSPLVDQLFEDHLLSWPVDRSIIQGMVMQTLEDFFDNHPNSNSFISLLNSRMKHADFMLHLFQKTIHDDDLYQDLIVNNAQNWERERIAVIDALLMKMAICEFINFPSIPVKVTINEYLEIAKEFSTPKSNVFINGILDKVLLDLKHADKIKKTARGLL